MVEKATVSRKRKIIGFVLTLILLPLLFVGSCYPLGLGLLISGLGHGEAEYTTIDYNYIAYAIFTIYAIVFLGIVTTIAIKTRNHGIRWGLAITVPAVLIATWFYLFS